MCVCVCVCVCQELQSDGAFRDLEVVIAGLSNIYTHYITTYEEYQVHSELQYCTAPPGVNNPDCW